MRSVPIVLLVGLGSLGCNAIFGITEGTLDASGGGGSAATAQGAGGSGAGAQGGDGGIPGGGGDGAGGGQGGDGGTGGATGGHGGEGGGPGCTVPGDCDPPAAQCSTATCQNMQCGETFAPATAPCLLSDATPGLCDGAGTCVECLVNGDCLAAEFCDAGACVAELPQGSLCGADVQCSSAFCRDGFCCDQDCDQFCGACVAALTGQADGSCAPVMFGQDPDGECGAGTCQGDVCNGTFGCTLDPIGTLCSSSSCSGGAFTSAGQCAPGGTCGGVATVSCPAGCSAAGTECASSCASPLVISEIFGGGGNSGAPWSHDYIVLHNRSNAPISLNGFSVQYASAGGGTWQVTALAGTVAAGGYYLIQQAAGPGGGVPLPTPDLIPVTPITMSATQGKVALLSSTTALLDCPVGGWLDLVGYGSASCFEALQASSPSNTTSIERESSGCNDSDVNASDFSVGAPTPENGSSPGVMCGC